MLLGRISCFLLGVLLTVWTFAWSLGPFLQGFTLQAQSVACLHDWRAYPTPQVRRTVEADS